MPINVGKKSKSLPPNLKTINYAKISKFSC